MPIYPTKTVDYNFDNPACYPGSGSVVTDLQGNLDLNFVGTPTFTSSAGNGSYFSFDYTTAALNHLASSANALLNGSFNFSYSYCIKPIADPTINSCYANIYSPGYGYQNASVIGKSDPSGDNWNYIGDNQAFSSPFNDGEWIVVTVTFDQTNDVMKVYHNGTLKTTLTPLLLNPFTFINPIIQLGFSNIQSGQPASSDIKAFSVWKNVVLTGPQVQDVADGFIQFTNPPVLELDATNASSYPGTGSTWFDLTANNNDLTLYGNTTWTNIDGVKSFDFDGINSVAYNSSLTLAATNEFSIDIWFKCNGKTSSQFIATLGIAAAGTLPLFWLNGYYGTGIYGEMGAGVAGNMIVTPPVFDIWYNMTAVADGTNVKYYLNGSLQNTVSQGIATIPSSSKLSIGDLFPPEAANAFFDGNVGYYAVYDVPLTAGQVSTNYSTNLPKFTPAPPYAGKVGGRQFAQGFNG